MMLSADQQQVLSEIERWWRGRKRWIRFGGLAGTGKTTLVTRIARHLRLSDLDMGYAAPTGKAARVLAGKLRDAEVGGAVSTLHSLLRRPAALHCAQCPAQEEASACHRSAGCGCELGWTTSRELPSWELLIVDESSMVDRELFEELLDTDYRILFVGDHGQLPPVGGTFDLMSEAEIRLEEIHRQAEGSGILRVAGLARRGKTIPFGPHGDDVFKGPREDAAIDWNESPDTLILCHTNELRMRLNAEARAAFRRGAEPEPGDRVVCRQNNRRAGIYNGMVGAIKYVRRLDEMRYSARIWLPDERRLYVGRISAAQFNSPTRLQGIWGVDLWEYANAMTVHLAQGSQADDVLLFDAAPWFQRKPEYRRWLYTGITRAAQSLTIVG
jgi:exodeoxyribonuclease-5